jgi:FkbM family methyltransferase
MHIKVEDKWHLILKQIEKLKPNYIAVEDGIDRGIALFGAGQFGLAAFDYLKKNNYKVVCFIDNAHQKQGTKVDGIPVVSSNHQLTDSVNVIFITAKHAISKIKKQINNKKITLSFDTWFVIKNFEKYRYLRDEVFCDQRSRECLDGVLLTMLTGNENYCADVMDFNQYFCLPQFNNTGGEYFVDAGAYVGDVVEKFIWAHNGGFNHIYAFEPCQQQFEALQNRKSRLIDEWALKDEKISLINAGLGEIDSYAIININDDHLLGANLTVVDNKKSESMIEVKNLDNFIGDKTVTFIKADIEGMEMAMLKGAENTIKKNKPKMALSVYHKPDDLLEISNFVLNIDSNYKIALRHHSPLLMDTTLYCWCN